MAMISVDLDPQLIARARELTGARSHRDVLEIGRAHV